MLQLAQLMINIFALNRYKEDSLLSPRTIPREPFIFFKCTQFATYIFYFL